MPGLPVEILQVPSGNSLQNGTEKNESKELYSAPLWSNQFYTQEKPLSLAASTWFPEDLESHQPREDLGVLEDPDSTEGRKELGLVTLDTWLCVHSCECAFMWVWWRQREHVNRGKQLLNCCKNNARNLIGTQYHRWHTYSFEKQNNFILSDLDYQITSWGNKILKILIWLTEWVHYLRTSDSFNSAILDYIFFFFF